MSVFESEKNESILFERIFFFSTILGLPFHHLSINNILFLVGHIETICILRLFPHKFNQPIGQEFVNIHHPPPSTSTVSSLFKAQHSNRFDSILFLFQICQLTYHNYHIQFLNNTIFIK